MPELRRAPSVGASVPWRLVSAILVLQPRRKGEGEPGRGVQKVVHLERSVLNLMNGGCQLPLGVYCDNKYVHVSFSDDAMRPSRYLRFPYIDEQDFPKKIVEHLQHQQV